MVVDQKKQMIDPFITMRGWRLSQLPTSKLWDRIIIRPAAVLSDSQNDQGAVLQFQLSSVGNIFSVVDDGASYTNCNGEARRAIQLLSSCSLAKVM